ncbi:MAG TPA: patatin-like phospholipase family protein [Hyphomicrobiaceae bacterium]
MQRAFVFLLAVTLSLLAAGCATLDTRTPVPNAMLASRAAPLDLQGLRAWGDEAPQDMTAEMRHRMPHLKRLAQSMGGRQPVVDILALSGGGTDGAFGAGLLAGWTKRGDRPRFEIVTGVSAGAITAPFAFLGPRYDDKLREIWTRYGTSELIVAQLVPGLLGGVALADSSPLQQLIARYIDRRVMSEIAAEYRKGRLLLVLTTNLDAQRPVIWNMGEIAASPHPHALDLFRKVILASASIPGALPPVQIPVTVDGKEYQEMHVDGGTTREVFITPVEAPLEAFDRFYASKPKRRIYIVKNGKYHPEYSPVRQQALPIAARAIETLIKTQHRNDIYRIYRMAKDGNADFNLAFIPQSFQAKSNEVFDPRYQAALFEEGFNLALSGRAWVKAPPDVAPNPKAK